MYCPDPGRERLRRILPAGKTEPETLGIAVSPIQRGRAKSLIDVLVAEDTVRKRAPVGIITQHVLPDDPEAML